MDATGHLVNVQQFIREKSSPVDSWLENWTAFSFICNGEGIAFCLESAHADTSPADTTTREGKSGGLVSFRSPMWILGTGDLH